MRIAILVLVIILCFLLAGAIPISGGAQMLVFRTPAFIVLMAILGAALVVCSVRRRPGAKQIGFWLAHLGAAAILAGGFIGYLREVKVTFMAPVDESQVAYYLSGPGGAPADRIDLGFGLAVKSLTVERYDPDYALYRPEPVKRDGGEATEYLLERIVRLPDEGELDLAPAGKLRVEKLEDEAGGRVAQYVLANGWLLERQPAVDKYYGATLVLHGEGKEPDEVTLAVNHPVTRNGWRFYLWSYDHAGQRHVTLVARRDPGRPTVIAGIWCLMIGVAAMCWLRGREAA